MRYLIIRNGLSLCNDYFDDMDWLCLALLRLADLTGRPRHLRAAVKLCGSTLPSMAGMTFMATVWHGADSSRNTRTPRQTGDSPSPAYGSELEQDKSDTVTTGIKLWHG